MTESFAIAPAHLTWALAILIPAGVILVGAIVMLAVTVAGSQSARFELSPEGLRLRGDLWGRLVPAAALRGADARAVSLSAEPQLAPAKRTMGTGLPGYASGWFRLRNGDKALVYLSDRSRVVYVPTTLGFDLLISPRDPARFLAKLRQIAPARTP